MSYVPSAAAQATAALAGGNLASLALPMTSLQTSIASGNLAPSAYIDAVLSSVGFQAESNIILGTASTSSATLANVPGASFSFTAALAKTYLVHCDFGCFASAAGGNSFRLVVNGNSGPTLTMYIPASGQVCGFHLMHAAACIAGANTIAVQWAAGGVPTVQTNGNCYANYVVTG